MRQSAGQPGCWNKARQVSKARLKQVIQPTTAVEHREVDEAHAQVGHRRNDASAWATDHGADQQCGDLPGCGEINNRELRSW